MNKTIKEIEQSIKFNNTEIRRFERDIIKFNALITCLHSQNETLESIRNTALEECESNESEA